METFHTITFFFLLIEIIRIRVFIVDIELFQPIDEPWCVFITVDDEGEIGSWVELDGIDLELP
jgi:hypothetical protein